MYNIIYPFLNQKIKSIVELNYELTKQFYIQPIYDQMIGNVESLVVYDENPKTTFKLFKPNSGVNYVDLPKEANETNMFAYNNTTCLHGTDRVEGVNKIILLTIHKTKDKQAMEEHFKRSAEKYPGRSKYS